MSNAEKFEAFKQKQIQENEEKYGTEIRQNTEKILFGNPMRR